MWPLFLTDIIKETYEDLKSSINNRTYILLLVCHLELLYNDAQYKRYNGSVIRGIVAESQSNSLSKPGHFINVRGNILYNPNTGSTGSLDLSTYQTVVYEFTINDRRYK